MWKTKTTSWLLLAAASLAAAFDMPHQFDVSTSAPKTAEFDLEITWDEYAPLGIPRKMLLVNGQTPGPELRFDQDDAVTVRVVNNSPFNTTIHFHGLEMHGTPWSDGVPGLTQRPIRPGHAFTYRFAATQHGSYWYHSHARDQIEDGLYGAIFIRPRPGLPGPFHLIDPDDPAQARAMDRAARSAASLAVFDLMRIASEDKWAVTLAAGIEITCYEKLLFNGKGRARCLPAEVMRANLTPAQKTILARVPGSSLTDRGCSPPKVMAAFGGNTTRFNESAIPPSIFHGCRDDDDDDDPVETIHATAGRWVALNIIGATNFATGAFAVDEHEMWVYAVDGGYVTPQRVHAIPVSNGERYSVLLRPARPGTFKLRYNALSAPQMITGYALLSVRENDDDDDAAVAATNNNNNKPSSEPWVTVSGQPASRAVVFYTDDRARPFPPSPVPAAADALHVLHMKLDGASYLWALNSTRLAPLDLELDARYRVPLLFRQPPPDLHHHPSDNVTVVTRNGTWVDLVLYASVFPFPPHPVHKHANKMYKIGSGTGAFRWGSVAEAARERPGWFDLEDPPMRDTFVTRVAESETSWIVVRYQVVNPGAWLVHCHISNHMTGGMMMVLLDGVDAWPTVPQEYLDQY